MSIDRLPAKTDSDFALDATCEPRTAAHALPPRAVRLLADEVVARLSRRRTGEVADHPKTDPAATAVEALCDALTGGDPTRARTLCETDLERGMTFDSLCETRLAPAARRLGTLWEEDRLSFIRVTVAASRLLELLRAFAPARIAAHGARRAVFAAVPGEEHILGVTMAAGLCRDFGWDVDLIVGLDHETLVARALAGEPDLVGLSISSDRALVPLTRIVLALRVTMPNVPILVCGPDAPWFADARRLVGADAQVTSLDAALEAMDRLMAAD